jgi:RNA polymerase sigma factor (sigma-70 family)
MRTEEVAAATPALGARPAFGREALALLFASEARSLVRLARLFVDHQDAAEDLVQEAFLRLQRSARAPDDPGKAGAYLRSVVLNLARDHNRRGLMSLRHHSAGRPDSGVRDDVDALALRHQQDGVLLEAVRSLPLRQRHCVVLRYYEELSVEEVAGALGLSPNSVKTHLRRAMDALGERMEGQR